MKKIKLSDGVYTVELDTPDEPISWDASFFKNCDLVELHIPEGATTVASYCFRYCRNIRKIHMPASVTYLGHALFYGTYAKIEIYYAGTAEQFKIIGASRKVQKEVQVPGKYDHQPYNNSEGTYYKTETVTEHFDSFCTSCTVICSDGEILSY